MLNVRCLILFIFIVIMPGNVFAQQSLPSTKVETNVVDIEILRDGKVVAKPKLIMNVGSTAVLTVAKEDGYSIKGSLSRDMRIANGRKIDLEFFVAENGRWKLAGKPTISVQLNGNGRVTYPDDKGRMLEIRYAVTDKFSGNITMQSWGQNKCSQRKIANWSNIMKAPVKASFTLVGQSPELGACCKSGNLTCCSDGPVCCGSGDGQSCCT